MRKRLIYGFSAFFLFSAILIFTPSLFKKEVSEILVSEINESLDAEVSFSEADINLWRHFPNFTFTFGDFRVTGKNHFKGDTLIHADELHLIISSWKFLLFDNFELTKLDLNKPRIHILTLENGEANYDILKNTPADSADHIALKIQSFEMEDGQIIYEDRSEKITISGDNININGDFNVADQVTRFDIAGLTKHSDLLYDRSRYIVNKDLTLILHASYDHTTGKFHFSDSQLAINELVFDLAGSCALTESGPELDVSFKSIDTEFRDIVALNDILQKDFKKLDIHGLVSLSGQVKGVYSDERHLVPTFDVYVKVADGFMKYKGMSNALNQVNVEMHASNTDSVWENTIVDLKHFSLNLGDNPVKGKMVINGFRDGTVNSDILARMKLQDLASIYPIKGMALAGDVNIAFESNGLYSGDLEDFFNSDKQTTVPKFRLDLAINNAGIKYDQLPEAIEELHLIVKAQNTTGKFDDTSLRLEKIHGIFGNNPLTGFVHVNGLKNPRISSEITARLDLSEIQKFLPIEGLTLKGLFDIDLKVQGEMNDSLKRFPMINASLNLKNGYVKTDAYPSALENAHLLLQATNETGKFKDTRFLIDTLTYSIDDEAFLVEGSISDVEKMNYDLAVQGRIYLDKLNAILGFSDVKMSGEVDVNFRTAGNLPDLKAKRYHQLPTTGQVKMKQISFLSNAFPHKINIEEGHLFFSNEKIFLDTLHGAVGKSKFNLTGHLYNYLAWVLHNNEKIKGDLLLESEHFTLNELLTDDYAHRDTVHHDLATIAIPENIDLVFDSKFDHLQYKDIVLDGMVGEIIMRDGILTLNETTFDVLGSEFRVSGDYDPRNMAEPRFDISLQITDLDINKAHSAFASLQTIAPAAEHTFGIFSINYELKGSLHPNLHPIFESLSGKGTVSIRDAQVNGMKVFHHISGITKKEALLNPTLKNIVMNTHVEKGVLYVKPFTMKLAGFDTDIEGEHNFSGDMNYTLKIAIPPFDIVRIPLHINGTYDNPKIHLGKGHEDAFAKAISLNN
jgi:AsmA protein